MPGELDLIRHIRARTGQPTGPLRLGIGDDCAVLRPPANHDILVTTDFSLEGRHFRRDWHPAPSAGHRCLARGLSDLAAMGAKPLACFLSLALPAGTTQRAASRKWVDGFMTGLLALAEATGTPLAGGDTSTAPDDAILADIVLLGATPRGKELRRSTARPGDILYVTGTLGGAAAELEALFTNPKRFKNTKPDSSHPHLYPQPRLAIGQRLRNLATSAIDLSDGLSTDLHHLCEASGVGARIQSSHIPKGPFEMDQALHGGEDYELLFTASTHTKVPRSITGIAINRIGIITRERKILIQSDEKASPLNAKGWEHHL